MNRAFAPKDTENTHRRRLWSSWQWLLFVTLFFLFPPTFAFSSSAHLEGSRMETDGEWHYGCNKDGNIIKANLYAWQEGDTAYEWYGNGILKSVRTPEGETVRFEDDALGRRILKETHSTCYRYAWDNNVLLCCMNGIK